VWIVNAGQADFFKIVVLPVVRDEGDSDSGTGVGRR